MAYYDGVGPLTWIRAGETQEWVYGWGDFRGDTMCIAGPDLDRNGSAYGLVWAIRQGKRMRIDNGPVRHEYFVTVHNDGEADVYYTLQVVTFP